MECIYDWQGMIDALTAIVWLIAMAGVLVLVTLSLR